MGSGAHKSVKSSRGFGELVYEWDRNQVPSACSYNKYLADYTWQAFQQSDTLENITIKVTWDYTWDLCQNAMERNCREHLSLPKLFVSSIFIEIQEEE